ncbi:MAG: creatininase family protein [Candidatus Jordarchaeum sp.]|uniref:creatininase family protein n=1 Tax=Candidatus Jordarchaeum sp. TaxID=2823881 RepID=UPI00404A65D2
MSSIVIPIENLTWKELDSMEREKTVILVPIAPLEQHGPHLPIGTDFFESIFITKGVGEKIKRELNGYNVLIHPAIPIGTGTLDKTGSIEFNAKNVKNIIFDLGKSLAVYDFKHIIIFACHGAPTFSVAIEEACEELNQQYGDIIFSPMGYYLSQIFGGGVEELPEELRVIMEKYPKDWHAGYGETSMMLNIKEPLVKKDYKNYESIEVNVIKLSDRNVVDKHGKAIGYFGYPAESSKQIGKLMLNSTIDILTKMSIEFIKRKNYKQYLHTFYWNLQQFRTNQNK